MSDISKWRLVDYFDVWSGDEEGSWQVNNATILFDDLVITDDATNEDIIDYLIEINYLSPDAKGVVQLVDGGDWIEIEEGDNGTPGYPIGRLDRVI